MSEPQLLSVILKECFGNNTRILTLGALQGGSTNHAMMAYTNVGSFCIKLNQNDSFPDLFAKESSGLKALYETGTIRVPEVIAHGVQANAQYILLEYIDRTFRSVDYWEDFGRNLAALHKNTDTHFGFHEDNYIGTLHQSNRRHIDWVEFFINERIEPQVRLLKAKDESNKLLSFAKLFSRLNDIMPKTVPALLHGDLWHGNHIVGPDGKVSLIDPAVYYGHPEMELSFTQLFGGFDKAFYNAYFELAPATKDFKSRADIYNLYPLLVHQNLFGGDYIHEINTTLKRYQ
jgi:protein-ribulosamine 3-kinase